MQPHPGGEEWGRVTPTGCPAVRYTRAEDGRLQDERGGVGGVEGEGGGGAYQSDDGGPRPGTGHDVQVVRQVELEQRTSLLHDVLVFLGN